MGHACCGGGDAHEFKAPQMPSNHDAPYELIYWPGIPGRGEFVRLLFEEAGVAYIDHAQKPEEAVATIKAQVSPDNNGDEFNPPIFAPPALKHGDLLLHQTPNILLYLAPRLGLIPTDSNGLFHLNQIVLTIFDGLVSEVHDTHHPICVAQYYEDQKDEAKKRSKAFIESRLPKFLRYVERLLKAKTSDHHAPWLYSGQLTYADLVLFQAIDGTKFAFPKTMGKLEQSGDYQGVFRLYEAVKARPNIQAYLASERRLPYSQGIYRHYPELEEEEE